MVAPFLYIDEEGCPCFHFRGLLDYASLLFAIGVCNVLKVVVERACK